MNQTSIVDATLNVLKQDEENLEQKFNNVDNQLSEISSRLQEKEKSSRQCVGLLVEKPGFEPQARHQNKIQKVFLR